ncbi:MAG: hypothetical protein KKA60_00245 [Proteobacteria bacterium]|nr:hypothetical protein [Pseudomonadota bacterium]
MAAAALFLASGLAVAGSGLYPGWEKGGAYDSLYRVSEYDSFKGEVVKIVEITPMPGMAPGAGLVVNDGDENILVHLGPVGFVDPKATGFKPGDRVKVKGVWADIRGEEIFLASKVKKGDLYQLKVRRTRDGLAFWEMSAEELEEERAEE